ncbi:hypothetical protein DFH09DRAFT_1094427 [Mycena vulgaris]|nr:hypothetical protein DFH09DRAFT_1094427 [Mycena vulgaris]
MSSPAGKGAPPTRSGAIGHVAVLPSPPSVPKTMFSGIPATARAPNLPCMYLGSSAAAYRGCVPPATSLLCRATPLPTLPRPGVDVSGLDPASPFVYLGRCRRITAPSLPSPRSPLPRRRDAAPLDPSSDYFALR